MSSEVGAVPGAVAAGHTAQIDVLIKRASEDRRAVGALEEKFERLLVKVVSQGTTLKLAASVFALSFAAAAAVVGHYLSAILERVK